MNILVLDDNELVFRAPEDYFVDPHDYRTDTIVQTACPETFWQQFYLGPSPLWPTWDEIWLDHDLGTPEYSGRTVTLQFAQMGADKRHFPERFYVISMNPVGSSAMVADLSHYTNADVQNFPIYRLEDYGVSRGNPITPRNKVIRHN